MSNPKMKEKKKKKYVFSTLIFALVFSLMNVNAQDEMLIEWKLDETAGSIAFDTSGNNRLGVLSNGANFETANPAFGTSDVDFDGSNDLIQHNFLGTSEDVLSISFWSKADTTATDTLFNFYDSTNTFDIWFNFDTNGARSLLYLDSTPAVVVQNLDSGGLTTGIYYHHLFMLNFSGGQSSYYRDNVNILNFTISNVVPAPTNYLMRWGTDSLSVADFDGDIDEIKISNFLLNETQRNEVFTQNILNIPLLDSGNNNSNGGGNNQTPINDTNLVDLITSIDPFTPNVNVENPVSLKVTTNREATCDLYIDNNRVRSYEGIVSNNHVEIFSEIGMHSYFYYCFYVEDTTQFYEISEVIPFNVTNKATSTLEFGFLSNEFEVSSKSLHLVSPCLVEGIFNTPFSKLTHRNIYNKGEYYFTRVSSNGYAEMEFPLGTHEICLIHGQLQYNDGVLNPTYESGEIFNQKKIGSVAVPFNETLTYVYGLTNQDIYNVLDVAQTPQAFGRSWTGAITSLFMGFLGFILVLSGARGEGNGKVVIAGVLLLMVAVGYQFTGLLGVLF